MVFFTIGNLLTLGIMVLVLILYRVSDRKNRSLNQLTDHYNKLKSEIEKIADKSAEDVRSYGIELKVEKESGKELMNRLHLTNEDLEGKAEAVANIEERLKIYGSSLEELKSMTARVQENLSRLEEESAFVDGVGRRLTEAKTGLEALERGLGGLELKFERENAETLEKTVSEISASVKSAVSDLAAEAETIERKVGDHREAVEKIEREREAAFTQSREIINETLKNAVEQAGLRADRMEESALVKLKEQAQERIRKLHTAEEEKLKTYQDSAKARVAEVQALVKSIREDWRTNRQEWEAKEKAIRDEYKKELQELKAGTSAAETEASALLLDMQKRLEEFNEKTAKALAGQEEQFHKDLAESIENWHKERQGIELKDRTLLAELTKKEKDILQGWEKNFDDMKTAAASAELKAASTLEELETQLYKRLEEVGVKTGKISSEQEALLRSTTEEMIKSAVDENQAKLETYRQAQEADFARLETRKNALSQELAKTLENWNKGREELEAKEKALEQKWEKNAEALNAATGAAESRVESSIKNLETSLGANLEELRTKAEKAASDQEAWLNRIMADHRASLSSTADTMADAAMKDAEAKLQTYRQAQEAEFARLESLKNNLSQELSAALENWHKEQQSLDAKDHAFRLELEEKERAFLQECEKNFEGLNAAVIDAESRAAASLEEMKAVAAEAETKAAASIEGINAAVAGAESGASSSLKNLEKTLNDSVEELRTETGKRVADQRTVLQKAMGDHEALFQKTIADQETLLRKALGEQEALLEKTTGDQKILFQKTIAEQEEALHKATTDHKEALQKAVANQEDALNKAIAEQEEALQRTAASQEEALHNALADQDAVLHSTIAEQRALLNSSTDDMVKKTIGETEAKLNAYRDAQENEFRQLEARKNNLAKELEEALNSWRTGRQEMEAKDKAFRSELEEKENTLRRGWEKNIGEMEAASSAAESRAASSLENLEKRIEELRAKTGQTIADEEAMILRTVEEMKQKALEATENKLAEYDRAQEGELRRLEALIEDSRRLDAELRANMQKVTDKISGDFALFEEESDASRKAAFAEFNRTAAELKSAMDGMEKELAELKNAAREELSDKMGVFEDDFLLELGKRSNDVDRRFSEWQDTLNKRLADLGGTAVQERKDLEIRLGEEMKRSIASQEQRILSELESLKNETGALEDSIRVRMDSADESLADYKEQLDHNLEEARQNAEHTIKTEIGNYALSTAERIKQNQREIDERIEEITNYVEGKNLSLMELLDASRRDIADLDGRVASIRTAFDEAYHDADSRRNEIMARSDDHAKSLETGIKEAERRIKEFFDQAKLIDRADELKGDMERRIEDLRGDIEHLDQRRAEAAQMENEFTKIRRLADEVNAKMTRIASEKYRIDKMESDFNRLLRISSGVEEKLTQVTASDDVLQETLVQIRKFEEALASADEKFLRLEKKESVLEATSDGIDRDFKALKDLEKAIQKLGDDISHIVLEKNELRDAVGILAAQNDKAKETANQISLLDDALSEIAEKTKSMQTAREWIARAETRLEELNKELKLMETIQSGKKGSSPSREGAPPIQKRENVITLARKGWTKEEIAKSLKLAIGEVEMILETFDKK